MNKEKFFDSIMDIVSDTMGVTNEQIISTCRKMSLIDARSMFVYYAIKCGFTTDYIMEKLKCKSPYSIQNLIDVYNQRVRSSYYQYMSSQIGRRVDFIKQQHDNNNSLSCK